VPELESNVKLYQGEVQRLNDLLTGRTKENEEMVSQLNKQDVELDGKAKLDRDLQR
jgi:hypothetical protein